MVKAICLILRNGDYFDLDFLTCKEEEVLTGGNVHLKEHWQFLEIFLIVTVEWRRATGISEVEARDAAKHPVIHRTAPATGNPSPRCQ